MVMRAMEEAGQGVLPFMRKMKFAPKSEQTANLMEGLGGLVTPTPKPLSAFERLKSLVRGLEGISTIPGLHIQQHPHGDVVWEHGGLTSPSTVTSFLKYDPRKPSRISTSTMESDARARHGWESTAADRTGRPFGVPPVALSMAQRQRGFDEIVRLLRQSGCSEMEFEAAGAGRPALFQKIARAAPRPTGRVRGPYRQYVMPISPQAELPLKFKQSSPVTGGPGGTGTQWLQQLNPQTPLNPFYAEQALGMSAEEALHLGLLREHGGNLFMTERGLATVHEWLGNLGGS